LGNNGWYASLILKNSANIEESMRAYFEQFGEITECTVMRENQTGRSRGFGFLTFKDPKCVNAVMVKEHILDGKIVRPLPPKTTPLTYRSIQNVRFLETNRTRRQRSLLAGLVRTLSKRNSKSTLSSLELCLMLL